MREQRQIGLEPFVRGRFGQWIRTRPVGRCHRLCPAHWDLETLQIRGAHELAAAFVGN